MTLRLVENPCPVLSPAQMRLRLAVRACAMSVLQAAGVYLIAHGSFYAGFTGFLISYNWSGAARETTEYRIEGARIAYGIGGSLGTLAGLALAHLLANQ